MYRATKSNPQFFTINTRDGQINGNVIEDSFGSHLTWNDDFGQHRIDEYSNGFETRYEIW